MNDVNIEYVHTLAVLCSNRDSNPRAPAGCFEPAAIRFSVDTDISVPLLVMVGNITEDMQRQTVR